MSLFKHRFSNFVLDVAVRASHDSPTESQSNLIENESSFIANGSNLIENKSCLIADEKQFD